MNQFPTGYGDVNILHERTKSFSNACVDLGERAGVRVLDFCSLMLAEKVRVTVCVVMNCMREGSNTCRYVIDSPLLYKGSSGYDFINKSKCLLILTYLVSVILGLLLYFYIKKFDKGCSSRCVILLSIL